MYLKHKYIKNKQYILWVVRNSKNTKSVNNKIINKKRDGAVI